MAKFTDKNNYTIGFAVALVIVVGVLLASFSEFTKTDRINNGKTEIQQNILFALNIFGENGEKISRSEALEVFPKTITEQYVIVDNIATKDNEAYLIDVKKEADKVKTDTSYKRKLPIIIGVEKGEKRYVIPMRGVGLWGPIWGYISLKEDLKTVAGVYFDHASETPGLGSKIKDAFFYEDFLGESIQNAEGKLEGISVIKGNNDPLNKDKNDNEIDAIVGATITSNGVSAMIKEAVMLYNPYFQKLIQNNK